MVLDRFACTNYWVRLAGRWLMLAYRVSGMWLLYMVIFTYRLLCVIRAPAMLVRIRTVIVRHICLT